MAAHEPTEANRATVEAMAGFGIPQRDISLVLRIDVKTLEKYYREQLDRGAAVANTKVAQNLFRIACGEGREAVTAAIFWCKTRMGWREVPREEPAGDNVPFERLGKKEQAQRMAATAGQDTGWGSDLEFTGNIRPN